MEVRSGGGDEKVGRINAMRMGRRGGADARGRQRRGEL